MQGFHFLGQRNVPPFQKRRAHVHGDAAVAGVVGRQQAGVGDQPHLRLPGLGHQQLGDAARGVAAGVDLEGVIDARELSIIIKELENQGLAFEGAEASFELLIHRRTADYTPPFEILDYTTLSEKRVDREFLAEATVKVRVDDKVLHTAADGNGPVNALDAALRKALLDFYPQLESMHLVDYKVRILDGDAATAARTRVIIDSQDGEREWSTMGSDTNIISASAAALADSFEYAIWKQSEAAVASQTQGGAHA